VLRVSTTGLEGPPVAVRRATPADLEAVERLVGAAGLPLDGLADTAVVLVAQADGVVVGAVALQRHSTGLRDTALLCARPPSTRPGAAAASAPRAHRG
jgi:hypothetical protein